MKLKYLKKSLAIFLSLSFVCLCAPFVGTVGESRGNIKEITETVAMSDNASAQAAVALYGARQKDPGNRTDFLNVGIGSSKDQAYVSIGNNNSFTSGLAVLTQLNGIDLTASNISIDGYSYTMVAKNSKYAYLGFLSSISSIEASISKNGDTYDVTPGSSTFVVNGMNVNEGTNTEYKTLKGYEKSEQYTNTLTYDAESGYSVTVDRNMSSYYFYDSTKNSFLYWNGSPKLDVSLAKNDSGYLYTVTASDIYTETVTDGVAEYTPHDPVTVVFRQLTAAQAAPYLKYVLLAVGNYSNNQQNYSDRTILFENISVTYKRTVEYDHEFFKDQTVTKTVSGDASVQSAVAMYHYSNANKTNSLSATTTSIGSADGSAYVSFNIGQGNSSLGLAALTQLNGVDLTDTGVTVEGYSYTMEPSVAYRGHLGFLASIDRLDAGIAKSGDTYTVTPGSSKYVINGMTVVDGTNTAYKTLSTTDINVKNGNSTQYTSTYTYDSEAQSYTVTSSSNPFGYRFYDEAAASFLYWNGTPKLAVSLARNGDGYLYTVKTASDIYTQTVIDDVAQYTPHDPVTVVSKQLTAEQAAPYLKYVLLPSAGISTRGDRPTLFKNISVTYTEKVDCTVECYEVLDQGNGVFDDIYSDGYMITKSTASAEKTKLEALKAAFNAADADIQNAILNSGFSDLNSKIDYNLKYCDVCEKKAAPELLGIQLKKVTNSQTADLRFAVSYNADSNTDYTVKSYGAVVVPHQVRNSNAGNYADLTVTPDVIAGKESYFCNVYAEASTVSVDENSRYYIRVANSSGKTGTLFDCRPYVVYTDGTDEFYVYADNDASATGVTNGQASKCVLFGAKTMAETILANVASPVYPDGYTAETFNAVLTKIGNEKTTAEEKTAVLTFIYTNKA